MAGIFPESTPARLIEPLQRRGPKRAGNTSRKLQQLADGINAHLAQARRNSMSIRSTSVGNGINAASQFFRRQYRRIPARK